MDTKVCWMRSRNRFQVADIAEEAILGMRVLKHHNSIIRTGKRIVECDEIMNCMDKDRRIFSSKVRLLRAISIPGNTAASLSCETTEDVPWGIGTVSRYHQATDKLLMPPQIARIDSGKSDGQS